MIHPLSQVEAEALKSMRTRLNKPAVSDAAAATLGRAFVEVMARAGVPADAGAPGLSVIEATLGAGPPAIIAAAEGAGLANLKLLASVLARRLAADPAAWRALAKSGAPQAIIGRRLQLGGREPSPGAPA